MSRNISWTGMIGKFARAILTLAVTTSMGLAVAGPTGEQVVRGNATVTRPNTVTTNIHQTTQNVIIDWSTFDVASNETVNFLQPSSDAAALNRIYDINPSQIWGTINANGRILLVNSHGFFFGQSASVNAGSLFVSTLDINNDDFMNGDWTFGSADGDAGGLIVNHGLLAAANGGSVNLFGGGVDNQGAIIANFGSVNLAAGKVVTIDFDGDGLLQFAVEGELLENSYGLEAAVNNSGTITAESGQILMSAVAARDVFARVVNNEGIIEAGSVTSDGGRVYLTGAGGDVFNSGSISATSATGQGGEVHVLGDRVAMVGNASVDVSGANGGGQVRIGGGFQGGEGLQEASHTFIGADVTISADATVGGDGGTIIVWSDEGTRFYGTISARGAGEGAGGFAEVSGGGLIFQGVADLGSDSGQFGTLLLDPDDIIIAAGTADGDDTGGGSGTLDDPTILFGDTPATYTVYESELESVAGTNIVLQATNSITTSGGAFTLNLDTNVGITLETTSNTGVGIDISAITIQTSLGGAITLIAGSTGGAGTADIVVGSLLTGNRTNNDSAAISITADDAITIDGMVSSGAVTSDATDASGAVTIVAGGVLQVSGTGTVTSGAMTGQADGGDTVVTSGAVSLTGGSVDITGAVSSGATDNADTSNSSSTSGNVSVASTAGGISVDGTISSGNAEAEADDANVGSVTVSAVGGALSGTGSISSGNATVAAGTAAGDTATSGNLILSGSEISADGSAALNVAVGTTNVTGTGATSVGTLSATATGSGAAGEIRLTSANSLIVSNLNTADADTTTVSVTVTGGNLLTIPGAGTIALDQDNVSLIADEMTIGANVSTTGEVSLTASTVGRDIDLGSTATTANTTLELSDAELDFINGASVLRIGDANISSINVSQAINTANVSTLHLTSGGNVTQAAEVIETNLAVTSSGVVTLDNANNDVDNLAGSIIGTGNFNFRDTDTLVVSTVDSVVGITSGTGGITLRAGTTLNDADDANDYLVTTGTLTLQSAGIIGGANAEGLNIDVAAVDATLGTNGNNITLTDSGTSSTSYAIDTGGAGNVTIVQAANDLVINGIVTTGNLDATATAGAISQTTEFTIGGTADFETSGNDQTITLAGDNDVTGAVTFTTNTAGGNTGNVSFTNLHVGGTNLGASTVAGSLTVISDDAIIQSGALDVATTSSFTTNNADQSITLATAGNALVGAVSFTTAGTAGNVTFDNDATAVNLGVSTVNGNLAVTSGSTIGQSGALTVSGTSSFTTDVDDQTITLTDGANAFTGAVSFTTQGVGNVAHVSVDGGTTVLDLGASTIAGNLTVVNGEAITDSGALTVAGTGSFTTDVDDKAITLDSTTNAIAGTVTFVTNGTAGHVTFDNGSSNIDFAASIIDGNLVATSGSTIGQSGALTVSGTSSFTTDVDDQTITLTDTANAFTGAVSFTTQGAGNIAHVSVDGGTTALDLGASTIAGNVTVVGGGGITQSGALTVAGTGSFTSDVADQAITLDSTANAISGAVTFSTLGTTGDVTFDNGTTAVDLAASTINGSLDVTSGSTIGQSGALTVSGDASFTTDVNDQAITLNNAGNDVTGSVSFTTQGTTGNVSYTDSAAVDIGASSIAGTFAVTSGGGITDSGAISVSGASTFTVPDANDIILDFSGSDYTGAVTFASGGTISDITIDDASAFDLQALDITGNLSVTSGGAITQSGAIAVDGTSSFTTDVADQSITLTTAGNDLVGAVSFTTNGTTGNVTFDNNATAVNLGASTVDGNLSVTTGSTIGQSGALTVSGTSSFTADVDDQTITLTDAANAFTGAVSFTTQGAGNIAHVSVDGGTTALDLGTSTIAGNITVVGGAGITQSGALTIAGTGSFTSDVADQAIVLDNASNAVTGAVTFSTLGTTGDVTFDNGTTAVDLAASTIAGNLDITSGSTISQSGALTVSGTSSFTTDVADQAITLANTANALAGAVLFSTLGTAGNVTIDNGTTALDFGTSTINGNLIANNGNAITQSGAIDVTGNASFTTDVDDQAITLSNASNDVDGVVSFTTQSSGLNGGDVTYVNGDPDTENDTLTIGSTTVAGAISVTGGDSVTLEDNAIAAATNDVAIIASNGDIIDANPSALDGALEANVTTTGQISLTAANGSVGATGDGDIDLSGTTDIVLDTDANVFISNDEQLTDFALTITPSGSTYSLSGTTTINISDDGTDTTINDVQNGGTSLNFSLTTTSGDILLPDNAISNINAGTVTLTAADSILNVGTNTAHITTDGLITLVAQGGNIGAAADWIDVASSTGTTSVDLTAAGSIFVSAPTGQTILVDGINTSAGADTVNFNIAGSSALTVRGNLGYSNLDGDTLDIDMGTGTLGFVANPVSVGAVDIDSTGSVLINTNISSAGDIDILTNSTHSITGNAALITNNVAGTAGDIILSAGSIGTVGTPLTVTLGTGTDAGELYLTTTGTAGNGAAYIDSSAGQAVEIGGMSATAANTFSVSNDNGDIEFVNIVNDADLALDLDTTTTGDIIFSADVTAFSVTADAVDNVTVNSAVATTAVSGVSGNIALAAGAAVAGTGTLATGGALTTSGNITLAGGSVGQVADALDIAIGAGGATTGVLNVATNGGDAYIASTGAFDINDLTATGANTFSFTTSAGGITLAAGGTDTGIGDVDLVIASAAGITTSRAITVGSIDFTATTGNVAINSALATSDVAAGSGGIDLTAVAGDITGTGSLTIGNAAAGTVGDITLTASGSIGTGVDPIDVLFGSGVTAGQVNVDFGVSSYVTSAGNMVVGDINANNSTGDIGFRSTGGTLTFDSAGTDLNVGNGILFAITTGGGDITLDRSMTVGEIVVNGTGDIIVNAAMATSNQTDGTSGDIDIATTGGNLTGTAGSFTTGTADDSVTGDTLGISSGNITVDVSGTIDNGVSFATGDATDVTTAGNDNVVSGSIDLVAGSIGTVGNDVSVAIGVASAGLSNTQGVLNIDTNAAAGAGDAYITSASDLDVGSIATGAGADDISITVTGGNTLRLTQNLDFNLEATLSGDNLVFNAQDGTFDACTAFNCGVLDSADINLDTTGSLTVIADSLVANSFADLIQAGGGITIAPFTGGTAINLGSPIGAFDLSDADLDSLVAAGGGSLTIGSATAGVVTIDDVTFLAGQTLTVVTGSTINDDDDVGAAFSGGTLRLDAAGAIGNLGGAQGLNMTVTNLEIIGAGSFVGTEADTVIFSGTSTVTGNLSLTAGTAIGDLGTINVGGTSAFTAGGAIALNNANDFTGTVSASAGVGQTVILNDINAIDLGTISAGALTVTANGAITDSGTITATGTTSLTAGAANDITLNSALNDFATVQVVSGNNVTLNDNSALNIAASAVSGNLSITTNGALTDSGNISVIGTTTLDTGIFDATLDSTGNNFSNVVVTSGNNVTLVDADSIALGNATVTNTYDVTADAIDVTGAASAAALDFDVSGAAGNITDTGGTLAVTGTSAFTVAANDNVILDGGNNFGGAVSVTGSADTVTLNDTNAIVLGDITATTLNVTASGTITDNAVGDLVVSGTSTFAAGANAITLDIGTNDFGTVVITSGSSVTLTDTNAIDLGTVNATTLNVNSTGAITDSGTLTVSGTSTFAAGAANNITLDTAANNFGTVSIASGNNVALVDANAIDLGASTVSGTLSVSSTGAITDSGALAITGTTTLAAGAANNITLDTAANNFSTVVITNGNNVTLVDTNSISLGNATVSGIYDITALGSGVIGTVNFTGTVSANDLDVDISSGGSGSSVNQSAGTVDVADTSTFSVGVDHGVIFAQTGNDFDSDGGNDAITVVGTTTGQIRFRDANDLVIGNVSAGTLVLQTDGTGDLIDTGTLVAGQLAFSIAGDATLDSVANDFNNVEAFLVGGNLTLVDVDDIAFNNSAVDVNGNFSLTAGGTVSQSVAMDIEGTTSILAAGQMVTLTNAGNDFTGAVSVTAATASLTDANAIDLGTVNATTLNVNSTGAITDSGTLTVSGTSTFAAGAANNITLDTAANNFGTVSITSGNNVALTDTNAIDLGASTVSGTLSVSSTGAITDSGALAVTGTTTLAAGAANNITLDNANDFNTVSITTGNNVALTDADDIDLGASTVSGTLSVSSTGAITDSGALAVTGTTTLAAGAANNITLDNANDFNTVSITTGNNVALTDADDIDLGASTVSGTLSINANGAVTDSGAVTVAGATTIAAGAANDITLNTAGNDFNSFAVTTGNNVTVVDADDIALGNAAVTGNFDLTAGGAVTQSGALDVDGTTSVSAAGQSVSLNNALNDFTGAVSVTAGSATITDLNALVMGASTLTGSLVLNTTGGALTQTGAIDVGTTTDINATGQTVTLTNASNTFTGSVTVDAATASLTTDTNFDLGASNIGAGGLTVIANGNISDSGTVAVGGTASFDTGGTTVGANDVDLDVVTNNFGTISVVQAGDVTIVDTNALAIGSISSNGTVSVSAGGAITDVGADVTPDITATTSISLVSNASIGTTGAPGSIDVDAPIVNASTTSGGIYLNSVAAGSTTFQTISAAGAGNDVELYATNDIQLGSVISPDRVDVISTAGDINDLTDDDTNANITAVSAVLSAGGDIGGNVIAGNAVDLREALEINAGTVTLTSNALSTVGLVGGTPTILNSTAGGVDVIADATVRIGQIDATGFDVTIDTSAVNASIIDAQDDNVADIIANNITLDAGNGDIGGTDPDDMVPGDPEDELEIDPNGTLTLTGSGVSIADLSGVDVTLNFSGTNFAYTSTADILIGLIDATGTVSVTTTLGSINDFTAGADGVVDINGTTITLTAATGIGSTEALELRADGANGVDASVTSAGDIVLNGAGALLLSDIDTANGLITIEAVGTLTASDVASLTDNDANDITLTSTGSSIAVGVINAGAAGDVVLTANGAITDSNVAATNITADVLTADAVGGIDLDTTIASADLSTTAAGAIDISESDAITLTNIDTSNGSISVTAVGAITATDVASLTDNDANDITLISTGGGIAAGVITAGAVGDVTLTANGAITDTNAGTTNITADALVADAAGGIDLDTDVVSADLAASAAGNILISEVDNISVLDADTSNGSVTIAAGGTLSIASANSSGLLDLDAANITVSGQLDAGSMDFDATTNLQVNAALISAGTTALDAGTLVTIAAAGDITSGGAVNIGSALAGNLQTAGNIVTSGDAITFGQDVTLTGGVLLNTTNGSAAGAGVSFNGTLNGGQALTITAGTAGDVSFTNDVGGATTLGSLAVTADQISFTGDLNTQAGGNVTLTNAGTLTFAAATQLNLGGVLLQNGAGDVMLGADIVTSGDNVTFAGATTLTDDISIDTTTSAGISFQDTVTGGGNDLGLNAHGSTVLLGGATSGVDVLTVAGASFADINADVSVNSMSLTGAADLAGNVDLTALTGGITITGTLNLSGTAATTSNITGATVQTGNVTESNDASLVVSSRGNLTMGNISIGTGDLSLTADSDSNTNFNTLTAGNITAGDVTLSGGSDDNEHFAIGTITSSGNIVVSQSVVLNSDFNAVANGNITLDGAIASGAGIDLLLDNGGTLTINDAISIGGIFAQTGAGSTTLNADIATTNDAISFAGPVTFTGNRVLNSGSGAGNITLADTITGPGAGNLTITAGTGAITMSGATGIATLDLNASGGLTLAGATNVATFDIAGLTGGMLVSGATSIDTANTDVNLQTVGGVNAAAGGGSLDIDTGNGALTFGAVGNSSALTTLVANASSVTTTAAINTTGNQTYNGAMTLGGNLTSTTGAVQINNPVTLASNAAISAGGNIVVNGSIDGARALTMTAGGAANVAGGVGQTTALTSLQVSGTSGSVGAVTTTGAQTYSADVDINGDLVGGSIVFNDAVNFSNDTLVTSDTIDFNGGTSSVTGQGELTLIPATDGATVSIGGGSGTLQINADALSGYSAGLVIGGTVDSDGSGGFIIDTVASTITVHDDIDVGTGSLTLVANDGLTLFNGIISGDQINLLVASQTGRILNEGGRDSTIMGQLVVLAAGGGIGESGKDVRVQGTGAGAVLQLASGASDASVENVNNSMQQITDQTATLAIAYAQALGFTRNNNLVVTSTSQSSATREQSGGLADEGFIDSSLFEDISLYEVLGSGIALPADQREEEFLEEPNGECTSEDADCDVGGATGPR